MVDKAWNPCEEPLSRSLDPFTLVLFGVTGDLARRKLIPALFSLAKQGLLNSHYAIVAYARREGDDDFLRKLVRSSLEEFAPDLLDGDANKAWTEFSGRLFYQQGELDDARGYAGLRNRVDALSEEQGLGGNRIFYLAVPPDHFSEVVRQLGTSKLVQPYRPDPEAPWSRVIIEKPFGFDLDSARQLNQCVRQVFAEEQIFRIDHYLGKETVQNILVTRFANKLFELLWNQSVIDNVQITVSETLGMEGRGAYFDSAGILRDIIQNHALQILTLIAMEPPVNLTADAIRDEKVKVLRSIRPFSSRDVLTQTVRGQYTAGRIIGSKGDQEDVPPYISERGVQPGSLTETYAALRVRVENWRWAGVPFYIRAGKRLPTRITEVVIELKAMPEVLFARMDCVHVAPNRLTLRIQPNEGTHLLMSAKVPGPEVRVSPVQMHFDYAKEFHQKIPDAYERLILDAVLGEASLFARSDEVETAWQLVTPILKTWAALPDGPEPYPAGTWGPRGAEDLLRSDGRSWVTP